MKDNKQHNSPNPAETPQLGVFDVIGSFLMSIVCGFKGHIKENHLLETDGYIHTKRCARCKCRLGVGTWKIKHIPPPNSTPLEIASWEKYCEEKWEALRQNYR